MENSFISKNLSTASIEQKKMDSEWIIEIQIFILLFNCGSNYFKNHKPQ